MDVLVEVPLYTVSVLLMGKWMLLRYNVMICDVLMVHMHERLAGTATDGSRPQMSENTPDRKL